MENLMSVPPRLEDEDPELGALLKWVCEHNSKALSKDKIIVDATDEIGEDPIVQFATARPPKKIGRNDPCPCKSTDANGKRIKYKKCCGKHA
jgi:hypothetical protein